ncbi:Probable methyltransferase PMT21, partial [Linum perenne]
AAATHRNQSPAFNSPLRWPATLILFLSYTIPTASHTDPLPPPPTHPALEISGGGKDLFLPALKTIHRPYAAFPFIASNRHIETIFASFFRSTPDGMERQGSFWVWEIVYAKDGSVKEVLNVMQLKGHKVIHTIQSLCETEIKTLCSLYSSSKLHHGIEVQSNFRCEMKHVLLEMDRILRPMGYTMIRESTYYIHAIAAMAKGMEWSCRKGRHRVRDREGEDIGVPEEAMVCLELEFKSRSSSNQMNKDFLVPISNL